MTKILISPNYGYGYYTENELRYPQCLTDREIIEMVENNRSLADIQFVLKNKYPNGLWFCKDLEIEIVPDNCSFIIKKNDGYEHLRIGRRVCNGSSNLIHIKNGKQVFSKYYQQMLDKQLIM